MLTMAQLMQPMTPHLAEEIWSTLGGEASSVSIELVRSKIAKLNNIGYREIISIGRSLLPSISKINNACKKIGLINSHPSKLKHTVLSFIMNPTLTIKVLKKLIHFMISIIRK